MLAGKISNFGRFKAWSFCFQGSFRDVQSLAKLFLLGIPSRYLEPVQRTRIALMLTGFTILVD